VGRPLLPPQPDKDARRRPGSRRSRQRLYEIGLGYALLAPAVVLLAVFELFPIAYGPLSKPAVSTVALLSFIWAWDSFKWPLLVTRDASMRVLAVGLQQFKSGEGTNVQLLMAFASLVVLPVVVLYFLVQKQFREAIKVNAAI